MKENNFKNANLIQFWYLIKNRDHRYGEEKFFKGAHDEKEPERHLFIWASRLLIVFWVTIVIILSVFGNTIQLA